MFLAFIFVGLCFGEQRLLQETPDAQQQISALMWSQETDVSEGLFVRCYIYHNYLNPSSTFWQESGEEAGSDTSMSDHIAAEPWYVAISEHMNHQPFSALTVSEVAAAFSTPCLATNAALLQQLRDTLNCAMQAPGAPACPQTPEEWVAEVPECATALEDETELGMQQKMQCARILLSTIFVGGIVDLAVVQLQETAQALILAGNAHPNAVSSAQLILQGESILDGLDSLNENMDNSASDVQAAIASEDIHFTLANFNLCEILQYADYAVAACPSATRL